MALLGMHALRVQLVGIPLFCEPGDGHVEAGSKVLQDVPEQCLPDAVCDIWLARPDFRCLTSAGHRRPRSPRGSRHLQGRRGLMVRGWRDA